MITVNIRTVAAITVTVACILSPTFGFTSEYPNYRAAKASLADNDCATAVDYLKKFKDANAELLRAHAGFAGRVDEQIEICSQESGGSVSGITGAIERIADMEAESTDILPDDPPS